MTRLIPLLFAIAASTACQRHLAAPPAEPLPDDLVQPYVRIQEGLAKDSIEGLGANAVALAAAARQLGAVGATLDADAIKLQEASTLADARQRFGALSEALVAYTKSQGRPLPSGVRQAWCPMAAKPWLQRGSTIANPYYGKEMPTCGEFK